MLSLKDFKDFKIEVNTSRLVYGGIACDDVPIIWEKIRQENPDQHELLSGIFGIDGSGIQCTP